MTLVCRCSGTTARMVASTCGAMIAAAMPCTIREITSMCPLVAKPHSAEATTNAAIPVMNMRRRPNRSPRRPPVISSTAYADA
jgi:hypothetical protein